MARKLAQPDGQRGQQPEERLKTDHRMRLTQTQFSFFLAWFTNRLSWVTTCRVGLAPPSLVGTVIWWGKPHPTKKPTLCVLPRFEPDLFFPPFQKKLGSRQRRDHALAIKEFK